MKRLITLTAAALLAVALAAPAAARHAGTPGAGAECTGITVAEAATGYESGYCP